MAPASAQPYGPVLSVERAHFQVDGEARFLYFVSYFDGVRAAASAARLEEDLEYLKTTLGADGLRVFPNWWVYEDGVNTAGSDTLFNPSDAANPLRPATLAALQALLERASAKGLVVDVTFTRETLPSPGMDVAAYQAAIVAAARALRPYRHVLFDLQNEFDGHGLTEAEVAAIRAAVNAPDVDPHRIVTASRGGDPAAVGQLAAARGLWVAAYHDPRVSGWHEAATLAAIADGLRAGLGAEAMPLYLQEPSPWASNGDATPGHHRAAAQRAKQAGFAAWTFHQRYGFSLQSQSFRAQVAADANLQAELAAVRPGLEAQAWGLDPADTTHFYALDALGSVRGVTDQAGAVVARHEYLPFGEEYAAGPGVEARRFTGKERDGETGLDYFGARHYVARAGRFSTVDPVLEVENALVDPQRWNRYGYALNSPVKYLDPDGRDVVLVSRYSQETLTRHATIRATASSIVGTVSGPGAAVLDAALALALPATRAEELEATTAALFGVLSPLRGGGAGHINKLNHIFGKAEHRLEPLINAFGSRAAAFDAINTAVQMEVQKHSLQGIVTVTVQVAGESVTVRGRVIDGVFHFGTAFVK